MNNAAPAHGATSRTVSWRATVAIACASIFVFFYYWMLLTDGKFLAAEPVHYGLTFNSMIEYMSRGRFDVDPSIVLHEGFLRNGRTYAYFGVVPALLRFPLLIWPRLSTVDFTAISCAIAATVAAVAQVGAVLLAGRAIGASRWRRRVLLLAILAVVFGGPQVQFLRPSMFQESVDWASAVASIFVLMAFRWCVDVGARRPWHLSALAAVAGVCLLTRVSTSIGLFAACGGIMLREMFNRPGTPMSARRLREMAGVVFAPSLILISFAVICGYINYQRWGSPLTFQDYRYYNSMLPNDPTFDTIRDYGYFNIRRIPFALSYFFVPIWTIIRSDGHFLFREFQDRIYYIVELPPATFLASDLLLCFLSVLGCQFLWRGRSPGIDRPAARWIASGLVLPAILMLMAIAITFRYRMEFYPLFIFLGLFGLFRLVDMFAARPRFYSAACAAMVVISIIFSHLFLATYKIAPWGDSADVEKTGWIGAFRENLHITYPAFDRLFKKP
jgi:hypothetical protein